MRCAQLIALLAMTAAPALLPAAENLCDRSGSKTTASPDGKWVANVQEEVCTTPNGAAAGITVVLAQAQNPDHSRRVFIMPVPRSRDDWPRIRWLGPDAVELRVANLSEAPAPEPAYEGIRITLTHCGDNPQDRQALVDYKASVQQWQRDVTAWAQKRKVDENAAGPRPSRPQEPRLDPGRCTD
jgi:hypothetical protein